MAEPEFSPEVHRFAAPRYFDDQARELVMEGEDRYQLRRHAP